MNFCSRSKFKIHSVESDCAEIADVVRSNSSNGNILNADDNSNDTEDFEECGRNQPELPLESIANESNRLVGAQEIENKINCPSLPSEGKVSENDMQEWVDDDDLSELSLETFIVGRRFADQTELNPQKKIILSRDPENAKDPNAIKVLSLSF